jgi:hypothetical protein
VGKCIGSARRISWRFSRTLRRWRKRYEQAQTATPAAIVNPAEGQRWPEHSEKRQTEQSHTDEVPLERARSMRSGRECLR